jgi:hypothetical protein
MRETPGEGYDGYFTLLIELDLLQEGATLQQ